MGGAALPARAGEAPSVPGTEIYNSRIRSLHQTVREVESDHRPETTAGAIPVFDWLVYGQLGVGSAYNSNLNGSSSNPQSASGVRLTPSVLALHDTGIHRTELYGIGDIRFYPSESVTTFDNTRVGGVETWEIQRDLIYRIQGQVGFDNDITSIGNPGQAGVPDEPIHYRQDFASTSLEKGFGRFFAAVGGSLAHNDFQNSKDAFGNVVNEDFRDGTDYTVTNRLGYYVSGFSYVYVEPSWQWQRYSEASYLNSDGTRIVAGVGSERISLFSGEIYTGYFSQDFEDPSYGTVDGPLYGGTLSWFPRRFLTFTANLDHGFSTSDFRAQPTNMGSMTEDYVGALSAEWSVTRAVTLDAGFGYTTEDYINSIRRDEITSASAGITYYFRNHFGLNVEYTYSDRDSNVRGAGYSSNFVSAGAKTRF
ncbi:outer membrane beta-barrel protein [Methyloligella sp. 2.7D]|uniref:outer membrane beta-barrel protein n=1 Tax=unclassified Methyloligella TaxID=2625955 RepID=UPI00157CFA11|nr:outer membrane beta-barrel protein [Methyloligella sp. GL2]QKP78189.1 outer membrane beta-barrel protein [Methyloligella sp. GL2]